MLGQNPKDPVETTRRLPDLPALAQGVPDGLAALRGIWDGEIGKIDADLGPKLLLSLSALEAQLTRDRDIENAERLVAFRRKLSPSAEKAPASQASSGAQAPRVLELGE